VRPGTVGIAVGQRLLDRPFVPAELGIPLRPQLAVCIPLENFHRRPDMGVRVDHPVALAHRSPPLRGCPSTRRTALAGFCTLYTVRPLPNKVPRTRSSCAVVGTCGDTIRAATPAG